MPIPTELIFNSDDQYQSHKSDCDFWKPIILEVLTRHNLGDEVKDITVGFNSTYPVFIVGDRVIKFFGHRPNWQKTFANETASHKVLAGDEAICTPKILASGQLFDNKEAPWPYNVSNRMHGTSWLDSNLTDNEKHTIITELGVQLKRIHALPINDQLKGDQNWGTLDIKAAAERSSLPKHLIAQVDDFMAILEPFDRVFVNGDIVDMHVFVKNGHLSGIIDWGDATITDRHYEIGKICNSLFPGDKALLRTLVHAAQWPLNKNFPTQSLGMALYRQAVGLTQHRTFDIFYKLPDILPVDEAESLFDLSQMLYGV